LSLCCSLIPFFFQAEDGIRDFHVTGVQTCALPIYGTAGAPVHLPRLTRGPGREHVAVSIPLDGASALDPTARPALPHDDSRFACDRHEPLGFKHAKRGLDDSAPDAVCPAQLLV